MNLSRSIASFLIGMTGFAVVQSVHGADGPAEPPGGGAAAAAECQANRVALETRMEVARSKGRMLLRQQLANQLAAMPANCSTTTAAPTRAARIAQLEGEISALTAELEAAERELRKLKEDSAR